MYAGFFCCPKPGRRRTRPAYPPGPETVSSSLPESFLPSEVQIAPSLAQSAVAGSTMVTSAEEPGVTWISHLTFLPFSSRLAFTTSPPVTVKAWSRRVL